MARYLKQGTRGTDVAQLQADLNRYLKPQKLLETDGIFGSATDNAVRNFQTKHGLTPDGIVGPKTHEALQQSASASGGKLNSQAPPSNPPASPGNPSATPGATQPGSQIPTIDTGEDISPVRAEGLTSLLAEAAVQAAMTQLHVREIPEGSNNGPDIQKYCRSAGKEAPALWCMAFVYWSYSEAAARLGKPHPMQSVPDWAKIYVTGVYAWAKENGKTVSTPVRGDVFCVPGGTQGRTHRHTGLVTEVSGGTVKTVEGNTNNDGSDNGIGVFARTRTASRLDFFRLP